MGGCIGSHRDGSSPNGDSSDGTGGVIIGRNQPLKPERPKWKSDVPLTDGQLRSKRDEFWDTAPAFEGRKEIWDALKAAAYALETSEHQMAQAIIDGANITLPNGTLMDCYDELGNRYQLPVYVLGVPTNLIEESSENTGEDEEPSEADRGIQIPLKFRLSNCGKDIKLTVHSNDTVLKIKKVIFEEEEVEVNRQRWFFSGKLIHDKIRFEDAKIPKGSLVQVIVSPPQGENKAS